MAKVARRCHTWRVLAAVLALACGASACSIKGDPTVQGRADQIVVWLGDVVDSVTEARDQEWLAPTTAAVIVEHLERAIPVIQATPAGAPALALAALRAIQAELAADSRAAPYLGWAIIAIETLNL